MSSSEMRTDVWAFAVYNDGNSGDTVDYGLGTTEREAIDDLAKKRNCQAVAYSPDILGGNGGWVLVTASGVDLWVHRGTQLPNAPSESE